MSLAFYMDVHVRYAVTRELRLQGIDALTAQEDGSELLNDSELLDRATELERVLFSQDEDFLVEATRRQRANEFFYGVVYAHQLRITIGQCVNELAFIAETAELEDLHNSVIFLPIS